MVHNVIFYKMMVQSVTSILVDEIRAFRTKGSVYCKYYVLYK